MKLTNQEIYDYAIALSESFTDGSQRLPVKINFYLQKNKNTLLKLAQDIEAERMSIIREYGQPTEENEQYIIPKEDVATVQKELSELFALEQNVDIYAINLNDFDSNLSLSMSQMEAMMFMIV